MFIERVVSGILYGEDVMKTMALEGELSMKDVLYDTGYMSSFMSLNPNLNGENPDYYVSKVVYEKGF